MKGSVHSSAGDLSPAMQERQVSRDERVRVTLLSLGAYRNGYKSVSPIGVYRPKFKYVHDSHFGIIWMSLVCTVKF